MLIKKIAIAISLVLVSFFSPAQAFAQKLPDFGTCLNPQGKVLASYDSGWHGIVGKKSDVYGSDAVYQSSEKGVTQCFCPTDGKGIQTNWFEASKLSQKEIDVLKKDGWTYIPTGSAWGLKDVSYLAKNKEYSCKETNKKKNQAAKVMSLASTGDAITIYAFVLSGAAFIITGMVLRKISR